MNKKTTILLHVLLLSGLIAAAQNSITGQWQGKIETPRGDFEMTYEFKAEGEKLTGTASSQMGTTEIQNGVVTGKQFSFDLSIRERVLNYSGELTSDNEIKLKTPMSEMVLARASASQTSATSTKPAMGFSKSKEPEVGYGKLSGVIKDEETKEPVSFATIALIDENGVTKDGTIADDNGAFSLRSIPSGTYTVQISFIGYEPIEKPGYTFTGKGESYDLDDILISEQARQLNEVVVEGERELIEEKVDRMVYNAEQDKTTVGGDAVDVLRRVPMLSVDLDGNVSLRGSSNIRVLIDNRPSTITASSISDALKQIPADQIKSVEVITSPSARYDAEGTGGIINIITKKNNLQGGSLSVRSSAGLRGSNLGLNGSLRKGRMGWSIGGHGRAGYNIVGEFENSQILKDDMGAEISTTNQSAETLNRMMFGRYNLGWDYELNKYNWVGLSGNFGMFNMNNTQDDRLSQTYQSGVLTRENIQDVSMRNSSLQMDLNLNYIKTFEKKGKELSILGLYSQNDRTNNFETETVDSNDEILSRLKNINDSYNKEYTAQLDYVEPIGDKQILEVGGKMITRAVNSDYGYFSANGTDSYQELSNRNLSNQFDYTQTVSAGYLSYTADLFDKKYSVKAGGRYEYTMIDAIFADELTLDIPSYGTFVPSINLSRKLSPTQTIKVAYNKRIQRPSLQFLNPNIQASNPLNVTVGNPSLDPEFTNNYEVGYSTYFKGTSINASAFMRNTTGSIQAVRETVGDTVYTSYQNIGEEDAYGLSLFTNLKIGNKIMLNGGLDGYYAVMNNNVADPIYNASNQGFVVSGRIFGSYKFTDTWSFQVFSFIRGRNVQLQGYQTGFYMYSLNLNKSFAEDKGSIGIGTENFLTSPIAMRTNIESAFITQNSTNYMYNANVKVNFSYRIGKLSTTPTRRKRRSVENNDLKEGGSNNMDYKP